MLVPTVFATLLLLVCVPYYVYSLKSAKLGPKVRVCLQCGCAWGPYRQSDAAEKVGGPDCTRPTTHLVAPIGLQNSREHVILSIATQESWRNDNGEYDPHEWHRVFAWGNLFKIARTLAKGQLVSVEGTVRDREADLYDQTELARVREAVRSAPCQSRDYD